MPEAPAMEDAGEALERKSNVPSPDSSEEAQRFVEVKMEIG